MKNFEILKFRVNDRVAVVVAAMIVFFVNHTVYANGKPKTLTKANEALELLKEDLDILVPIAAAVILICLAVSYAGRFIEKDTFLRWSVGVIVAGSAMELARMLLNKTP
ncbi:VirB2 family type IV secretion system major pilin TrwL [Bartonella sp. CB178]|uniref:VirB2 family type IV secretion system major pilin TrwL n=1 Tax=Bartonella sp. CB178 TaxID=3112255 RepID=UPI00300E4D6F